MSETELIERSLGSPLDCQGQVWRSDKNKGQQLDTDIAGAGTGTPVITGPRTRPLDGSHAG